MNNAKTQTQTFLSTERGTGKSTVFPMQFTRNGTFDVAPLLALLEDAGTIEIVKRLEYISDLAITGSITKAKTGSLQYDFEDTMFRTKQLKHALLVAAGEIDLR